MNLFSSFGITRRLYAVVTLIAVALGGIAVFAAVEMGVVIKDADRIRDQRVPQLQRTAAMELDVTSVLGQLRHAMLARNPEERAAALTEVGKLKQHFEQALAEYEKAAYSDEGRRRAADIAKQGANFWEVGGRNVALIQNPNGDQAEAFAFLASTAIPAPNALLAELSEASAFYKKSLDADVHEIETEAAATRNWLVGLVVGTVGLLLVFSWHVAAVLRRRIAVSQAASERVRDGDFTQPVRDDAKDEFSALLQAMQEMQASLSRIVSTVRGNAEGVATASAQIAQGNQDLSQRTEEQASALEETAASMEQLGSTVKANADNARQANQLAMSASTVAIQGGEVVGQVVTTMKGINDSSKKIADIINVIDGIAFQTNILALNAAVEAARAGEQGRGFAVVASEVRSLAQRSAEAAKEIKGLITASVERVEQGTLLVDRAGSTMTEVVGSIKRVTDIMGEISAASTEQSAGVSQVGEAVSQMDQVTQQNAALVEESAAAAESLKSQAQQLVQAVSVFKLSQGEVHAPAPVASYDGAERRGPDRAKNVTRPKFSAKPKAQAPVAEPASVNLPKTGTDGEWSSV